MQKGKSSRSFLVYLQGSEQPEILRPCQTGKECGRKEGREEENGKDKGGALEESTHMWNKGPKVRCPLTNQHSKAQNLI